MRELSKHQKKCFLAMSDGNKISYYNNLKGGYRYYITNSHDIQINWRTVHSLYMKKLIKQTRQDIGGGFYTLTALGEAYLLELLKEMGDGS